MIVEIGKNLSITVVDDDLPLLERQEYLFLIHKYEGLWRLEVGYVHYLISQHVLYLKWLIFVLDQ